MPTITNKSKASEIFHLSDISIYHNEKKDEYGLSLFFNVKYYDGNDIEEGKTAYIKAFNLPWAQSLYDQIKYGVKK